MFLRLQSPKTADLKVVKSQSLRRERKKSRKSRFFAVKVLTVFFECEGPARSEKFSFVCLRFQLNLILIILSLITTVFVIKKQ
jgi:hypothetical protein